MSRSFSHRSRSLRIFLALSVLAFSWFYNQFLQPSSPQNSAPTPQMPDVNEEPLQSDIVVRIADGDSLELKRGGRLRIVGVDCPELAQRGGREAAAFTKAALQGKQIEYSLCAEQPRDQYGRSLGYIYIEKNGKRVLFNTELLRQGYARVYTSKSCVIDRKLWNTYYEEARLNKRGLFATMDEVPDASAYRRQDGRNR